MITENIFFLMSISLGLTFGVLFILYYMFLKEHIRRRRHKYLTPAALRDNSEWQTLIEDWRSLSQLESWTPKYSRAEEAYRLKFRKFLQTDLDKLNILHIPIVALALQCTEVHTERYHTRHGDFDHDKSLDDSEHIRYVLYNGDVSEDIASTIREIRKVEDLIEDQGVDAALKQLKEVKSKLLAKYDVLPSEI